MSQLAREFPEEYARIAALPPSQQNAAERALADRVSPIPMGLTQQEPEGPRVTRNCRDCDAEYTVPEEHATSGSKWWSLCGSCIQMEM